MIELTEKQIEEIRDHAKHRKDIRDKLEMLRSNRGLFVHVDLTFSGKGGKLLRMTQGERGSLMGDMLDAFEKHLMSQDLDLTHKLQQLGVKVS